MDSGKIPKAWKTAKILPLFKKGDRFSIENYRPISNISSLSKIFENALLSKFKSHYDLDILMGEHQHAFREGSSTITACLSFQDFVASQMDLGNKVICYSTDLTAAFDLLRPNILVNTLLDLRVSPRLIRIVSDFLANRSFYVNCNGVDSFIKMLPIGCVQGSVLGPFLFNVYLGSLQKHLKSTNENVHITAYADDCYVALPTTSVGLENAKRDITVIFDSHREFLSRYGMVCNTSKTDLLIFGFNGPGCSIRLGGNDVRCNDSIKILGLSFEKSLKWNSHVSNVIKKANSVTYSMRILNQILPRFLHRQVIFAHFVSRIMYGSQVWASNITIADHQRIDTLWFKVLRMHCFDFRRILTNEEVCASTNIRSFKSMRMLYDSGMLHRLCLKPLNTPITLRLIEQSYFHSRYPNGIKFFDNSLHRVGKSSFISRAKSISEMIPFEWGNLSEATFRIKMKSALPLYIR